ncbi:MAG: hypothetical protein M3R43_05675 [Acidobacteriota bacterium]|nr:hypothetical protein [Acidobacteriota bacterium]
MPNPTLSRADLHLLGVRARKQLAGSRTPPSLAPTPTRPSRTGRRW